MPTAMNDYLQIEIAMNSLQSWFTSLVIAAAIILLAYVAKHIILRRVQSMLDDKQQALRIVHDVVKQTRWLFVIILALSLGTGVLEMQEKIRTVINTITVIALLIQMGLWASVAFRVSIEHYRERQRTENPASVTTINILNFTTRVLLWVIVLLLVLDNLGVNITALVAGLGVGGVAVALAVQTILSDLLSSLSIALDKPFVIGDFLMVGDMLGSVEYVGLKTTRLRSLSGEQLVFSNTDLLGSRIRNFGRMYERRVAFNLGVTYQTTREQIRKVPAIIREAIETQDRTRFDRSHFKEYGAYSLNFESVYYINGPDYNQYMDIQQAINLTIHEGFEREGIDFAYPTQTLVLQQAAG
ncbi:MAG: mechanosensitive ion channel family protein [Gammaproteobacteria bacterium]|nr:mechanosensitive ion channel family protein [Gammaproteobacteria bacterium]